MKKRISGIITAMVLCLIMLPVTALAAESVSYLDSDGNVKSCTNYTEVTKTLTTWSDGWYVAKGETMSIGDPKTPSFVGITVNGNVNLILKDNCNLTIYGYIKVSAGGSLTIYGQSDPTVSNGTVSGSTGKLTAVSPRDPAGAFPNGTTAIGHPTNGVPGCDITINGGVIDARGSGKYPGIQGKNVTINGGYVKATVNNSKDESPYPSGINGQNVTINDGYVDATGENNGAGICCASSTGSVTINGGTVNAKGGSYGAGIGANYGFHGGSVTIKGGTVNATGGDGGAGIGISKGSTGGSVAISGGNVNATGGSSGAGIGVGSGGSVTISGGTVNAKGGSSGGSSAKISNISCQTPENMI